MLYFSSISIRVFFTCCLRDSIAFIKSIFSSSSVLGCSSPSVVRSLGYGVFMLVFRLVVEFLPWCLLISYRCYLMGLLKQDQVSLLARGTAYKMPSLYFLAPAMGQDPSHHSEESSGTGPGSPFASYLTKQRPTTL